jgi:hypothetical protein
MAVMSDPCGIEAVGLGFGPMDPRAFTWFAGAVLPWIESVFPYSWGVFRLSCGSFNPRAFLWLVNVLCLEFKGVFSLHFCSNSCIALFSRGHVELTLFWINMHARNVNSPNFLIKLMVEIGRNERQQDPPHLVFAHPWVNVRTKVEHLFRLI